MFDSIEAMLEEFEGKVPHAYTDSEGYITAGIGRLLDKRKGGRLRDDEIALMLKNDIRDCNIYLRGFKWFYSLDQVRQAVAVSMVFQLGSLEKWPGFLNAMAVKDYMAAANAMMDSKVAKEQAPRRWKIQADMMRSGRWPQ